MGWGRTERGWKGGGGHTYEKDNGLFCVKRVRWANEGRMGRSTPDALLNDTKTEGDNDTERRQPSALRHNDPEVELPMEPGGVVIRQRKEELKEINQYFSNIPTRPKGKENPKTNKKMHVM